MVQFMESVAGEYAELRARQRTAMAEQARTWRSFADGGMLLLNHVTAALLLYAQWYSTACHATTAVTMVACCADGPGCRDAEEAGFRQDGVHGALINCGADVRSYLTGGGMQCPHSLLEG